MSTENRESENAGYPVEAVANFFIKSARDDGQLLTHLKIQKLVYIAHGWHLAFLDKPLINEPVEAWKYGPVIKSLYHALKLEGKGGVRNFICLPVVKDNDITLDAPMIPENEGKAHELLGVIWKVYGGFAGSQLVEATHKEGTPWKDVYDGDQNTIIPNREIRNHYTHLREKRTTSKVA